MKEIILHLQKSDGNIEVLQAIIDRLSDKPIEEHSDEEHRIDLHKIPLRCIWHGFFPSSVAHHIHQDTLLAHQMVSKLIKCMLIRLHELWLVRCQIIHAVLVDGTNIEEKVDLQNEIKGIRRVNRVHINFDINKASTTQIKGWLFAYYAQMNDRAAYDNINKRTLEHRYKINKGISEEGYIMRENML